MEQDLKKLLKKYNKQWDKNGMGAGISLSVVVSDLEKIIEKEEKSTCKCSDRSDSYKDAEFVTRCWHCDKPIKQ